MTADNNIPVLRNIVLAGKQPLIRENSTNPQDQAGHSPLAPDSEKPHPVDEDRTHNMPFTTQPQSAGKTQDKQEQELRTQAEILLGIMEEKLGIYLIRRRKKLLDALVEQLRSHRK